MIDPRFKHVQYLWKDEEAAKLTPSERLVYRSNRLGDDLSLTNTGGGNTSAKVTEKDPLRTGSRRCISTRSAPSRRSTRTIPARGPRPRSRTAWSRCSTTAFTT
jgi:hypothetical protein